MEGLRALKLYQSSAFTEKTEQKEISGLMSHPLPPPLLDSMSSHACGVFVHDSSN